MQISQIDFDALEAARSEANYRLNNCQTVPVQSYDDAGQGAQVDLLRPGSLGVFITRRGSQAAALLADIAKGDTQAADRLGTLIKNETAPRKPVPLPDAVAEMSAAPVFVELRHSGKVLASNLYLPQGVTCVPVALPYTGGALIQDGIEVVEYLRPGEASDLQYHAIARAPDDLSAAEAAALQALDATQLELNLGPSPNYALMMIAFASAVCAATGICCPHQEIASDSGAGFTGAPDWLGESSGAGAHVTVAQLLHRRTLAMQKA